MWLREYASGRGCKRDSLVEFDTDRNEVISDHGGGEYFCLCDNDKLVVESGRERMKFPIFILTSKL